MARLPDPTQLFRLDGRTAVVTGASSGLGERFARVLSAAGATIVAGARRQERLDGLVADLRSQGAEVIAVRCDVTVDSEVEALIAAAVDAGTDTRLGSAGPRPVRCPFVPSPKMG